MTAPVGRLRVADLIGSKVVTADGCRLGRVVELRATPAPEYRVTGLLVGRYGWLHRLHVFDRLMKRLGPAHRVDTIPWDTVEQFNPFVVRLKPGAGPPDRAPGADGARSQGRSRAS